MKVVEANEELAVLVVVGIASQIHRSGSLRVESKFARNGKFLANSASAAMRANAGEDCSMPGSSRRARRS